MRCFPSGPVPKDAGPYKPIGWLLISRCVFLTLTRFSPLHTHRQGHIHIYNTRGNTHTHAPYTRNIHRHVTTHTHTHPLGDFQPYYWSTPLLLSFSKPSSPGAKPLPCPWSESQVQRFLPRTRSTPELPECSLDILGGCSQLSLKFLHLAHLAIHLGGFYLRASVRVAVAASCLKHALGMHTQ